MLTPRQQETIKHLQLRAPKTPLQIIEWSASKIATFNEDGTTSNPKEKHPRIYYQQILDHYKNLVWSKNGKS